MEQLSPFLAWLLLTALGIPASQWWTILLLFDGTFPQAMPQYQELIKSIFENAIASLSDEDKRLPHVSGMLPMLLRGIAVHHSGMLPLIREVVELLFQENLIKVLFATETFAIGLNMPTKTVVFSGVRKFDGVTYRNISVGEYTQMAGRAG